MKRETVIREIGRCDYFVDRDDSVDHPVCGRKPEYVEFTGIPSDIPYGVGACREHRQRGAVTMARFERVLDELLPLHRRRSGLMDAISQRLDPELWEYTCQIEQESDGRWIAEIPEVPGAMAYGATPEEAKNKAMILATNESGR